MRANELGYAASQVVALSAASFVVGAVSVKSHMLAPILGGTFYALIAGGDLAIYYATNMVAEKCKMTQWKAQILQGSLIGVYNVAVVTAFVAYGIFSLQTGLVMGALYLMLGSMPSVVSGLEMKRLDPWKLAEKALPQSFTDFRPFRSHELSPQALEAQKKAREALKEKKFEVFLQGLSLQANFLVAIADDLRTNSLNTTRQEAVTPFDKVKVQFFEVYVKHWFADKNNTPEKGSLMQQLGQLIGLLKAFPEDQWI